jgi:hypothetical protein
MVDDHSIMEQTNESQSLAKELEGFKRVLPDKFMVGGIIARLPPTWTDFATSLKHKRQVFNIVDHIDSLDVEEKARAKDTHGKEVVETFSFNVIQKNNSNKSPQQDKEQAGEPYKD